MSALSDSAASVQPESQPQPWRALSAVPDRATREAAAAVARLAYCEQLKEVRTRRGITLTEIAERSKVNEGLYAGLERGDVSRWPTGIYRRSFFREYALALGLPIDAALSEFLQLFPEEGEQRIAPALTMPGGPLRMTLADRRWLRTSRLHVRRRARRSRDGRGDHRGGRMVDADRHGHRGGDRCCDLLLPGHRLPDLHAGHVVASYPRQPQTRQGTPPGALTTRTNTSWFSVRIG